MFLFTITPFARSTPSVISRSKHRDPPGVISTDNRAVRVCLCACLFVLLAGCPFVCLIVCVFVFCLFGLFGWFVWFVRLLACPEWSNLEFRTGWLVQLAMVRRNIRRKGPSLLRPGLPRSFCMWHACRRMWCMSDRCGLGNYWFNQPLVAF